MAGKEVKWPRLFLFLIGFYFYLKTGTLIRAVGVLVNEFWS